MKQQLRDYVTDLFADAPQTRKTYDLREEMIMNLNEKFDDLVKSGMAETDAYNMVISSIGDIDELIRELKEPERNRWEEGPRERQKSALITSIAVMMFILSIVVSMICVEVFGSELLGMALFFIMIAIGVGMLVYNHMTRPNYRRREDTVVEEFKEFRSGKNRNQQVKSAVVSCMWTILLVIYFAYSFLTAGWWYSWIIFLVGAALSTVINAYFNLRG